MPQFDPFDFDFPPDPFHQITDDEFEQMVEEAESQAKSEATIRVTIGAKRFRRIRTFQVPLAEISLVELVLYFQFVVDNAPD